MYISHDLVLYLSWNNLKQSKTFTFLCIYCNYDVVYIDQMQNVEGRYDDGFDSKVILQQNMYG